MSAESEHQVLGERYELERIVREDALGRTWRAIDLQGTAKVDLRMLPDWADRTAARAVPDAMKMLKHPGLVGTLGMIADGKFAAYVLDANDGETMPQRRARRPRRHFEISEIKPWLRSIVEALGSLHGQGRVHGALHIGSFLIDGGELKITDLAVAPLLLPQAKCEGRAALPAAVMSPAVLASQPPGIADDIYALGAVIYDLLTGQPLFSSGDIPTQVMDRVPPRVQDRRVQLEISSAPLPPPWEDWIAAALAKEAKRRPSLDQLSVLLRSGQFGGGTSPGRSSGAWASSTNIPPPVAAAIPANKKVPLNLVILVSSILAAVALMAGVYVFKVKPRREFKTALDAAYHAALNFDETTPAQHDAVMRRWQKFEDEWQPRVQSEQPESQSTLLLAQQKRQTRALLKGKEEERARQEDERRHRAYVSGARAAFDVAKVKAGAAGVGDEGLAVWREFLTTFEVDFQGVRPVGIAPMVAEARSAQQSIEKVMAGEKKEREDFIAQRLTELTALDQMHADADIPAVEKMKRVEALIAACAGAPASALSDPSLAAIQSQAAVKLEMLRAAVLAETTAMAQYPDTIFADAAAKAFSKNERQRLLKKVQEALKTAGHLAGEPSGTADQSTHDALVAFQNANKLPATATLDEATLAALQLGDLADGETPMPGTVAGKSGGGSRSKSKPKEEKKTVLQKGKDGVKKVGTTISNFFTGKK